MSNLNAIGLIMALSTAGIAVATYVMARNLEGADTIVTGVLRGVTVPTRYRWIMLFHNTLPFLAFLALYLLVSALGFMEIARNVSDERHQARVSGLTPLQQTDRRDVGAIGVRP